MSRSKGKSQSVFLGEWRMERLAMLVHLAGDHSASAFFRRLFDAELERLMPDEADKLGVDRSKDHHAYKLSDDDVLDILDLIKQGKTYQSIANRYGVSLSLICHINRGSAWGSLTGRALNSTGRRPMKLKPKQVMEIVGLVDEGLLSYSDIAKRYNINSSMVSHIAKGRAWSKLTGRKPPKKKSAKSTS